MWRQSHKKKELTGSLLAVKRGTSLFRALGDLEKRLLYSASHFDDTFGRTKEVEITSVQFARWLWRSQTGQAKVTSWVGTDLGKGRKPVFTKRYKFQKLRLQEGGAVDNSFTSVKMDFLAGPRFEEMDDRDLARTTWHPVAWMYKRHLSKPGVTLYD